LLKIKGMFIQQLYTNCLSAACYYVESNGEAAIIDPLRDIDSYITLAKSRGAKIKYVFETHFHADFVSGHLDLGKETGAPIVFGPLTQTKYSVHIATDGEEFKVGNLVLKALHTPGHTIESTCYLLSENNKQHCVFSGDTLFVGDVGRPDLSSGNLSKEELAEMLFESLQTKIKTLDDDVIVYPAHGPGSSCGKNLGPEKQSTIRHEKQTNYALLATEKNAFVALVTDGLEGVPPYFAVNARINQAGYTNLEDLKKTSLTGLTISAFKELYSNTENVIILDTRHSSVFTQGFIPGSIFIGLEGRFAEWVGNLLPHKSKILLVTEIGKEEESIVRLARVGFDSVLGYLSGGFEHWLASDEKTNMIIDIEADELALDLPFDDNLLVLDVRRPTEFGDGHIKDASNIQLQDFNDVTNIAIIDDTQNIYIHCAGGYRSVIAASILKKEGYDNIKNILGGWSSIKDVPDMPTKKEAAILN
jgi:hydroxyacylglutathione hydrolase